MATLPTQDPHSVLIPYSVVRHFKGGEYVVHSVATHTETEEPYVVYSSLEDNKMYVRPQEIFMSQVDKEKYPDAQQEMRFEYVCPLIEHLALTSQLPA